MFHVKHLSYPQGGTQAVHKLSTGSPQVTHRLYPCTTLVHLGGLKWCKVGKSGACVCLSRCLRSHTGATQLYQSST